MIEHTVKGIISTLYENFDKKHIKGNELKNSMNALCECVSNKEDIKTVVKNKLEVVAETYNHFGNKVCPENYCEMMNIVCEGFNDSLSDFVKRIKVKCGIQENTTVLKESELNRMLVEAVAKNIKKLTEGRNDEPSNTHYAVHKPTNTIVFSWDYSGYDSDELRQFKKDYFISDLIDMGMDPKEVTILTRKACERKGINPTDDSCWSNYPMIECNSMKSINEEQTSEPTYNTMQEAMDDYDNISGEFSPNQIKNMTDIEDDDELNAAADAENGENMMSEIFQCLSRLGNGANPYKCTYSFNEIKNLFADFGFDYQGPNEEEESHVFSDGNRELLLTPTMFYEKQNMLRIQNLNLF